MRQNFKFIVPLMLVVLLLISACELQRSEEGDIAIEPPDVGGETAVPPTEQPALPPTEPAEQPAVQPTEETADTSGSTGENEIDPEVVQAPETPNEGAVEPGTVLVKLNEEASIQARSVELDNNNVVVSGVGTLDQKLQEIGASGLQPLIEEVAEGTGDDLETFTIQAEEVSQLYKVNFSPDQDPFEVSVSLSEDPSVEYAEPNFIAGITGRPVALPTTLEPNDPLYSKHQWNLQAIQMPAAWDVTTGDDVIVAIIDTGVAFNASDLAGTDHMTGYDFVNADADPTDDNGHGTHVAGTVAQTTNNGIGVAGVAFNATILPVKALGASGNGSYANIIQAIIYAVDQGADVINMSLAGRTGTQALQDAVKYAYDRGVVVVAATGNDGQSNVYYPAGYDEYVIAVGAVRVDNTLTSYSNHGTALDLVAPGGDVGVDQNNDGYGDGVLQQTFKSSGDGFSYRFFEGTSMASPHVAGLAALLVSQERNATPDQIENYMASSARSLGAGDQYGAGLIQAANALSLVTGGVQPTVQPTTQPTTQPTEEPTVEPTEEPTIEPTMQPTAEPTEEPTIEPTEEPTIEPTMQPTAEPTEEPTIEPTKQPTVEPTMQPTAEPTTQPTVEPTTQPTTQPPTTSAGELVVNGGFESEEGWTLGDTPVRGSFSTDQALSGSQALKLGITEGRDLFSFTSAWQQISIPAEANQVTLTANVYPISQDSPGADAQNVLVLDRYFRVIRTLDRSLSNSQSWETRTYDLSDFKGQTIFIYFGVFNRGRTGLPTAMYIDDVSVTWSR
ncbi:MAG: S8 family serine peptidase [Anaerolineae bacterium]|nr:S8 family serine peptidase [Anaerolineae bacterium]